MDNAQNNTDVAGAYGGFDQLAAIERQASEHDQAAFAGFTQAEAQPEKPDFDVCAEAKTVIKLARDLLAPMYPCLTRIYTEDKVQQLAQVSAPLMEKYGINSGGLMKKFGHEIAFAVVVTPLALQTVAAIREEKAIAAAKEVPANEATAQAEA